MWVSSSARVAFRTCRGRGDPPSTLEQPSVWAPKVCNVAPVSRRGCSPEIKAAANMPWLLLLLFLAWVNIQELQILEARNTNLSLSYFKTVRSLQCQALSVCDHKVLEELSDWKIPCEDAGLLKFPSWSLEDPSWNAPIWGRKRLGFPHKNYTIFS